MNFDDYFAHRNELAIRMLVEVPEADTTGSDGRFVGIGVACLACAVALEFWASLILVDAGYFARTSTFLEFLLLSGASMLVVAKFADVWLARLKVRMREALKEQTVARLISVDGAIANRLADQTTDHGR